MLAGVLSQPTMFPKAILMELLEQDGLGGCAASQCVERGGNVNVVYYDQVLCYTNAAVVLNPLLLQLEWSVKEKAHLQQTVPSIVHPLHM